MKEDYLQGKENWLIRMVFYFINGTNFANTFRNIIFGIIGIYAVLKLTNPLWMVAMFLFTIPVLTLLGYYVIHKMNKVNEWLSMRFATHYAIKQFDLNEEQTELLREINKSLSTEKHLKKGKKVVK